MNFSDYNLTQKTKRLEVRPFNGHDYNVWREGCLSRLPKKRSPEDLPRPKEGQITKEKFKNWLKWDRESRKKDLIFNFGFFRKSDGAWLSEYFRN